MWNAISLVQDLNSYRRVHFVNVKYNLAALYVFIEANKGTSTQVCEI